MMNESWSAWFLWSRMPQKDTPLCSQIVLWSGWHFLWSNYCILPNLIWFADLSEFVADCGCDSCLGGWCSRNWIIHMTLSGTIWFLTD